MLPLAACGGADAPSSEVAAESEAIPPPAEGTVADASSEFGVTECDDYITKYMACVGQMPAAAQDAARQALDQTRTTWRQVAATEQGRAGLAAACTAAVDASRTTMSAYGCTF